MTFSIYQLDANGNEKIVGNISSADSFLFFVKKSIPNAQTNYRICKDTTFDNIIKNDICYPEGFYLLCYDKMMQYVEKNKIVKNGYLYNSVSHSIKLHFTWKIFDYDDVDNCFRRFLIYDLEIDNTKPASFLINSKHNSEKNVLVRNILLKHNFSKNFKNTLIICSQANDAFYRKYFTEATIIYDINLELVDDFSKKINGYIVFDDCINDFYSLSALTANLNISYIVTVNNSFWASYKIAHRIDYIFLMSEDSIEERRELWFCYKYLFPFQITFEQLFDYATKNHSAMVINNTIDSKVTDDKVLFYNGENLVN